MEFRSGQDGGECRDTNRKQNGKKAGKPAVSAKQEVRKSEDENGPDPQKDGHVGPGKAGGGAVCRDAPRGEPFIEKSVDEVCRCGSLVRLRGNHGGRVRQAGLFIHPVF